MVGMDRLCCDFEYAMILWPVKLLLTSSLLITIIIIIIIINCKLKSIAKLNSFDFLVKFQLLDVSNIY
jgi:hypothetical protein